MVRKNFTCEIKNYCLVKKIDCFIFLSGLLNSSSVQTTIFFQSAVIMAQLTLWDQKVPEITQNNVADAEKFLALLKQRVDEYKDSVDEKNGKVIHIFANNVNPAEYKVLSYYFENKKQLKPKIHLITDDISTIKLNCEGKHCLYIDAKTDCNYQLISPVEPQSAIETLAKYSRSFHILLCRHISLGYHPKPSLEILTGNIKLCAINLNMDGKIAPIKCQGSICSDSDQLLSSCVQL